MGNLDKIQKELDRVERRIEELNALLKESLKENELDFCQELDRQLSPLLIRQDILITKLDELTKEEFKKIKIWG